jgi:hypothetical protein
MEMLIYGVLPPIINKLTTQMQKYLYDDSFCSKVKYNELWDIIIIEKVTLQMMYQPFITYIIDSLKLFCCCMLLYTLKKLINKVCNEFQWWLNIAKRYEMQCKTIKNMPDQTHYNLLHNYYIPPLISDNAHVEAWV